MPQALVESGAQSGLLLQAGEQVAGRETQGSGQGQRQALASNPCKGLRHIGQNLQRDMV